MQGVDAACRGPVYFSEGAIFRFIVPSRRKHDGRGRKQSEYATAGEREEPGAPKGVRFAEKDLRDREARDDEEHVDSHVPAGDPPWSKVKGHHQEHGETAKALDVALWLLIDVGSKYRSSPQRAISRLWVEPRQSKQL